ncbi:family 16 glycosylhydrolase [Glycomyces sp. YM15]|uniref:family 16 glycosylhydrolase n=1 Tax=Glycomyces sp. YM15 TaxID=2800446 RepID=UPI0019624E87|nr:family 16 glycosylhydrolase [Glycomyces sp. YM15]
MAFDPDSIRLGRRGLLAGGGALALSTFVAAPASAAEMPPNPLEKPGWILDRNDEFNGSLDSNLWVTKYLESRTTAERASARYGFRNNALVLRIDDDQPTYYSDNPMKVSSIQTGQKTGLHKTAPFDHSIPTDWKYAPKYGYFEIRAKTSARSGIHAAFWTLGWEDTPEHNAEIDIMEDPGPNPDKFLFNLHKWSDPNVIENSNTITAGFDLTSEMHIYGLQWDPSQIKLFVDNNLVKTISSSPAYNMVFLLSIYENAGWTGTVDPTDTRPKEFVIDYFRAYKPGGPQSGQTYRLRNVATGQYLDSGAAGAVALEPGSIYDDQQWILKEQQPGYWTIDNVREGRKYLDTQPDGVVIWNDGWYGDDTLWSFEAADGGLRINNKQSGRGYLYGSGSSVGWNTGAADANTVWTLEPQ